MATATLSGPAPALDVPDDCEVVFGQIYEVEPMSFYASAISNRLHLEMGFYLRSAPIGVAYHEAMFRVPLPEDETRVRKPDLAFVSFARWPADRPIPFTGNPLEVVPDLAVEVVSPTDQFEDVVVKAGEYLRAGSRLVWVILPRSQSVYVYTEGRTAPAVFAAADTLDGGDVLPGFAVRVGDLFPPATA